MKLKRLTLVAICLLTAVQGFCWGQKGHDVIACIAENHLTGRAARHVKRALGGRSMVYFANWLDIASHTPEYAYSKTWHYLNIDAGMTLDTMEKDPNGDVLTAVTMLVDKLKAGNLSAADEQCYLKMLIHLVGDMHCPMHTGHRTDTGGNKRPVLMFGRTTNLHSVWDTALPEAAHKWSHTEWKEQLDRVSKQEMQAIQSGTPRDWLIETHAICKKVYECSPEGVNISYDYTAAATPIIEQQFLRGGLRLARLLNEIYR